MRSKSIVLKSIMGFSKGPATLQHYGRLRLAARSLRKKQLQSRGYLELLRLPAPVYASSRAYEHTALSMQLDVESSGSLFDSGRDHNVALAGSAIHGLVVSQKNPFSFWQAVGAPSKARGFRVGREVRAGCVVPTIGGGICLLSNALYQMAVALNFTIIQRHAHTMNSNGMDATLAWPHVDLKFAPKVGSYRIAISDKTIRFMSSERKKLVAFNSASQAKFSDDTENCFTCNKECGARSSILRKL